MKKRIYYHDTDAGGVVYYGNYLKYLEESRTEFLEQKGIKAHGDFLYAVRKCNITYKAPARYGDTIRCESVLTKMTAAQLFFEQTILNDVNGQILVTAEVHLVCLTPDFKPVAISDEIRDKLQ
ncbi:MAG: YbgC/FadM family acyl-CoA thioesterase [Candidatus Omnitrophica bacterium]|nr:YbgC/FadM family acyl-CoA thioesterase [Candidatus Omnitrophota bacterium]